jgi:hypothetical protein
MLGRELLAAHPDGIPVDDLCPSAVDLNPGLGEHAFVDAVQARDLAVLVVEQRRPVEARFPYGPAVAARDLEILAEMRGVGEQLLGDAADIDAGAAEAAVFGDRDFRTVACGDPARADPARTAAYREEVVIESQLVTSDSPG